MEITFADGTRIEVQASSLNDFIRHDLKWVEYVHGRATSKQLLRPASLPAPANPVSRNVKRCPPSAVSRCCQEKRQIPA
ncbi:MAG TPA: hypothetical protein VLT16_10935 [Candidatus Limnocylindrales bacterium]|nr:hypothetical protein [Candidatus Limnocylindrales bacterium]